MLPSAGGVKTSGGVLASAAGVKSGGGSAMGDATAAMIACRSAWLRRRVNEASAFDTSRNEGKPRSLLASIIMTIASSAGSTSGLTARIGGGASLTCAFQLVQRAGKRSGAGEQLIQQHTQRVLIR